jgi:hypothetical protein
MEVAALFERAVTTSTAVSLYIAPSGEPALGPVAFMHRPSAMDDPMAPLGHHWQDATHISFGVITAGIFSPRWKVEGSLFNGREPDDRRWNFDRIRLDSYAGRVTFNPSENWSFTTGYGYLKSPEILEPGEPIRRLVASALHGMKIGAEGQWASTLVYGANAHEGHPRSHSVLLESELVIDRRETVFGRAELVQKSGAELDDQFVLDGMPNLEEDELFSVAAFSLGYIHEVGRVRGVTIGLGARGTVNVVPSALELHYGSRTPLGGMVFIRLRPHHESTRGRMPGMEHIH